MGTVASDRPDNPHMGGLVGRSDELTIHCYGGGSKHYYGCHLSVLGVQDKQLGLGPNQLDLVLVTIEFGKEEETF